MIVVRSGYAFGSWQLVGAATLVHVERGRQTEDGLAVLHGHDPPGGERAPIADAVDVEDEAPAGQAWSQEVTVQRVGVVIDANRESGGPQRLRRHLPAEQP